MYIDLNDILSADEMKNFSFSNYYMGESKIIIPALQVKGYTVRVIVDGERDSFGPLSRVIKAVDNNGNSINIVYG